MATNPVRKRFTLTFDVIQSSGMYEGDPYTEMSDEQILAALNRMFDVGVPRDENIYKYRKEHPEYTGYIIDWGEATDNLYGPEEVNKFIPEDTMLNIECVAVEPYKENKY